MIRIKQRKAVKLVRLSAESLRSISVPTAAQLEKKHPDVDAGFARRAQQDWKTAPTQALEEIEKYHEQAFNSAYAEELELCNRYLAPLDHTIACESDELGRLEREKREVPHFDRTRVGEAWTWAGRLQHAAYLAAYLVMSVIGLVIVGNILLSTQQLSYVLQPWSAYTVSGVGFFFPSVMIYGAFEKLKTDEARLTAFKFMGVIGLIAFLVFLGLTAWLGATTTYVPLNVSLGASSGSSDAGSVAAKLAQVVAEFLTSTGALIKAFETWDKHQIWETRKSDELVYLEEEIRVHGQEQAIAEDKARALNEVKAFIEQKRRAFVETAKKHGRPPPPRTGEGDPNGASETPSSEETEKPGKRRD